MIGVPSPVPELSTNATAVEPTVPSPLDADGAVTVLAPITVYMRPGCGFCRRLQAALESAGIAYAQVDIWEDPDAAAFVRSVAGGNETVPTVTVGGTTVVNPSAAEVAALAAGDAPDGLDAGASELDHAG